MEVHLSSVGQRQSRIGRWSMMQIPPKPIRFFYLSILPAIYLEPGA